MRIFILLVLLEIIIGLISLYRFGKSIKAQKRETKELICSLKRETERFAFESEKKIKEMERMKDLFLEDIKNIVGNEELESWKVKISQACVNEISKIILAETNGQRSDEVYNILKEYEEWRKQKLG